MLYQWRLLSPRKEDLSVEGTQALNLTQMLPGQVYTFELTVTNWMRQNHVSQHRVTRSARVLPVVALTLSRPVIRGKESTWVRSSVFLCNATVSDLVYSWSIPRYSADGVTFTDAPSDPLVGLDTNTPQLFIEAHPNSIRPSFGFCLHCTNCLHNQQSCHCKYCCNPGNLWCQIHFYYVPSCIACF